MKISYLFICLLGLSAMLLLGMSLDEMNSEKSLLKTGDSFPTTQLIGNLTAADRAYLGIGELNNFRLHQIPAKIILVEFFNKYCPHCQQQTPILNVLFEKIQQDAALKSHVKMLGIGTGNSQRQLDIYRAEKHIPFPLFPDAQYVFHDEIGRPKTPFIVLVKQMVDRPGFVSATYMGLVSEPDSLLHAMNRLLLSDVQVIQTAPWQKVAAEDKKSVQLSEDDFIDLAKDYLRKTGAMIVSFERIASVDNDPLYQVKMQSDAKTTNVFIRKIYRPTVCDVCHDAYFWYIFDSKGVITHFAAIHLTKAYNQPWKEKDIQKVAQRILNHPVTEDFQFDSEIDAVSSATMTSSLIFDTINKTKILFNKLKEEGKVK